MKMCDLHAPAPMLTDYLCICSSAVGLTNVNHTLAFLRLYVIVIMSMCLCVPV